MPRWDLTVLQTPVPQEDSVNDNLEWIWLLRSIYEAK